MSNKYDLVLTSQIQKLVTRDPHKYEQRFIDYVNSCRDPNDPIPRDTYYFHNDSVLAANAAYRLSNWVYVGNPDIGSTTAHTRMADYSNPTSATVHDHFSYAEKQDDSFTLAFTEGVETSVSIQAEGGLPVVGGVKVKLSGKVSVTSAQEWTTTTTNEWDSGTDIDMVPYTSYHVDACIKVGTVSGSFSAKLSPDYTVPYNVTGILLLPYNKKGESTGSFPVPLRALFTADEISQLLSQDVSGTIKGGLGLEVVTSLTQHKEPVPPGLSQCLSRKGL